MSLAEALERAATALPDDADAICPANGDPLVLLDRLDDESAVRVAGAQGRHTGLVAAVKRYAVAVKLFMWIEHISNAGVKGLSQC